MHPLEARPTKDFYLFSLNLSSLKFTVGSCQINRGGQIFTHFGADCTFFSPWRKLKPRHLSSSTRSFQQFQTFCSLGGTWWINQRRQWARQQPRTGNSWNSLRSVLRSGLPVGCFLRNVNSLPLEEPCGSVSGLSIFWKCVHSRGQCVCCVMAVIPKHSRNGSQNWSKRLLIWSLGSQVTVLLVILSILALLTPETWPHWGSMTVHQVSQVCGQSKGDRLHATMLLKPAGNSQQKV